MISCKNTNSGLYLIFKGDKQIGMIYKCLLSHGFCLSLKGIFFRDGKPNTVSGALSKRYKRLRDAKADIETILIYVGK